MNKIVVAFSALFLGMIFSLLVQQGRISVQADSGAIWTTNASCGSVGQDLNHFAKGQLIYVNGAGFDANQVLNWDITGNPGGSSCDPNQVVASGTVTADSTGAFCFSAYTVAQNDCGEYKVNVGNKGDNYRVDDDQVSPTPTSTPTATPTLTATNTPTVTPTIGVSLIRKTFMCYDSVLGSYWRIRNDGGVTSGTITWKINQSALTDIGTLTPGEAVFFHTEVCGVLTVYENGVSKGTATCNQNRLCEATPTPTLTATPTPTTPSNRPTPTPTPTESEQQPTATPTITLTPGPGKVAALEYQVSCDKDEVKAEMRFTNDGKAMENVTAEFDYNGNKKTATSNSDGWAIVIYPRDGENKLTGYADGFYKIEKTVEFPDCPATGGAVLGTSTTSRGQVLGATSYAKTGIVADTLMQLTGVLGTLMVSAGALMHAKQK